MSGLGRGLYEVLVTQALKTRLEELGESLVSSDHPLRPAEAADRIALHLGQVLRRAVEDFPEKERAEAGIILARELVCRIQQATEFPEDLGDAPAAPASTLRAISQRQPDGSPEAIAVPLIPLLDTTLLTNAPGEPRVGNQVQAEIDSADRIDVVMAFIRRSGLRPLRQALARHCGQGRPLRVLTTTYTGSTEAAALDELVELGAQVSVSYDTSSTRLHAKAWMFHRQSGFSTAYIGSSNLTHMAQVSGLEWNVRVSGARNPDVVDKVSAVFESYWNSGDFIPYEREDFFARTKSTGDTAPVVMVSPVEIRPEPFQERLLEELAISRRQGHHRNLLVSATGTGKTVMAALDYQRLKNALPRARLLFVAHREEILSQSRATFCQALRDPAFGELWVGKHRPNHFEHVFASIQSLTASGLKHLAPDHFDVVVVDEFHHAAAQSYERFLDHVRPRELLGLTATPERADGLDILARFGDRIAADLRLWDAIDQHRLSPFLYYGIHDGVDLRQVPWRRGRGYDVEGLSRVLTGSESAARLVVSQLQAHAENPTTMRALGFCVSVEHARFMARVFENSGIRATAIWGSTPEPERKRALGDLQSGAIQVLFSVDLFNEGLDVPLVDTLLFLRPTDSPVLFLQQLGRGLRKAPGKSACTVLDFVGHHRKEFRFDRRFRALLGGSRKDLTAQVQGRFPFLPAGCHMELDAVASKIVLANIKAAVPSRWAEKAEELRQVAEAQPSRDASLATFLEASGLELDDVYSGPRGWSDLRAEAGLPLAPAGPNEAQLRRAVARLQHLDDPVRVDAYRSFLASPECPAPSALSERDRRLLRMLTASLMSRAVHASTTLEQGTRLLWDHPQVRAELLDLLDVLAPRTSHAQSDLPAYPEVPLQIHARYTRNEILAGFGVGQGAKVHSWQTGVYWAEDANADLFAFTLDKTSGQFSPTTRYRDYAINRELIHWESQSVTRADSETGLRYQTHQRLGSSVMLFARLRRSDRAFWFLGPAKYVRHEGERPMAVTWRLHCSLPGDLLAAFAAAVA